MATSTSDSRPSRGRRTAWRLALLALIVLSGGNCPNCDGTLRPQYQPRAARCATSATTPVHLSIIDQRKRDRVVGVKKNGWNVDSATVYLEHEGGVTQWLHDAIASELQRAGFSVLGQQDVAHARLHLRAVVREFFAEPKMMWIFGGTNHGLVLVELQATFTDGSEYARLFKGHETGTYRWASDSETEAVLLSATQAAFAKMTRELCNLVTQHGG